MLGTRELSVAELNGALASKLCQRTDALAHDHAVFLTAGLVSEAYDWLTRMELKHIGVRPIYEAGELIAACLCNHNNEDCDCGVHADDEPN